MEMEQTRLENPAAMTYDEVSMERSKSFVKALQELKNLRPQLYSAADYCEKSYLHGEQKQMVLDNLKDYAVRALVNAVDHLGKIFMFAYTDKEGLRQQQLLAFIPRHHKHYILPNSVNKKVHFNPRVQTDVRQNPFQARSRLQPSGSSAAKTLSWHLASETKSTLKGSSTSTEDAKTSGKPSAAFQLVDKEENMQMKSAGALTTLSSGGPASSGVMQTLGITRRQELSDTSKPLTAFRSFENPRREIVRTPARSKSMLSGFFVKQKTPKAKAGAIS